jgi:hypothetical protein
MRDDPVDRKLAEFINCAPLRVRFKIMRLERESEGVYKYGMKRVFIKIENDQIVIRVGGGFMNFEQFVEQYCSNTGEQEQMPGSNGGSASKKKPMHLLYGGHCLGNKEFKTFYYNNQGATKRRKSSGSRVTNTNATNNNMIAVK